MVRRLAQYLREVLLQEMPIVNYKTVGDFSKELSFRDPVDRRLVSSPAAITKIKAQWARVPQHFDIYMVNRRSVNHPRFFERGEVPLSFVRDEMKLGPGLIPDPNPGAITVIYTNNEGDARVMMAGWTMAHRFGHALSAGRLTSEMDVSSQHWDWFTARVRMLFNDLLSQVYGVEEPQRDAQKYGFTPSAVTAGLLINAAKMIGSMKSARAGTLRNWGEFGYELLAQYITTGSIKLKPLPELAMLWYSGQGLPSHDADPEARSRFNEGILQDTSRELEQMLNAILDQAVGKIFVM